MKGLLELHNSVYPSNIKPVPNLRKCMSSVNKAESAPLQFSPHSGGEDSHQWREHGEPVVHPQ